MSDFDYEDLAGMQLNDAELLALEMTVVQQPFVLDFAEVRLDFPLEFPDDVWASWLEEKQEQFGER